MGPFKILEGVSLVVSRVALPPSILKLIMFSCFDLEEIYFLPFLCGGLKPTKISKDLTNDEVLVKIVELMEKVL